MSVNYFKLKNVARVDTKIFLKIDLKMYLKIATHWSQSTLHMHVNIFQLLTRPQEMHLTNAKDSAKAARKSSHWEGE